MITKLKSVIQDYIFITIGVTVYSFAVAFFFLPYKLTSGGVTGVSSLIFYSTGYEVQYSYFIINIVLLALAMKTLGWKFLIKTIFATNVLTASLWVMQRVYEYIGSPLIVGDELFMATVIGAIIEGVGLAICFLSGGSTGGTDIIAAVINKYRNVSLGTVLMLCDVVIISSCYFIFHDIRLVMFGYVYLVIASITLDYFITHQRQAVEFKIYSRNPKPIAEAIIKTGRGVTLLDGMGYYTQSDRKVIVSVVRRREQVSVLRMIKSVDPYAFVTMGNVSGVWGEGFDNIKIKAKRSDLQRRILVLTTDDTKEILKVQEMFGNAFSIRSLSEIGCDTNNRLNEVINKGTTKERVAHIKTYYGFDSLSYDGTCDNAVNVAVSTGKEADECILNTFVSIEDAISFLQNNK